MPGVHPAVNSFGCHPRGHRENPISSALLPGALRKQLTLPPSPDRAAALGSVRWVCTYRRSMTGGNGVWTAPHEYYSSFDFVRTFPCLFLTLQKRFQVRSSSRNRFSIARATPSSISPTQSHPACHALLPPPGSWAPRRSWLPSVPGAPGVVPSGQVTLQSRLLLGPQPTAPLPRPPSRATGTSSSPSRTTHARPPVCRG